MAHPPKSGMERGSKVQGIVFLIVVLIVAVGGIMVVKYPTQFGLPGPRMATPVAIEATTSPATPIP